jgi:uncharacterized protein YaaR (DUF327 family)
MSAEEVAVVKYEGDELSVLEKPPRDCKAVVEARENMLGSVDLDGFLNGLTTVGKFVRIAYNGVAGDTELQTTMREIGFDIAELCDDSGLTIGKFRMTADSILTDLTGAYQFFLDGMEEMAITAIESVGDSAKQMEVAANKLCDRFKEEKKKVLGVCRKTAQNKGFREQEVKKLEEKQQQMEAESEKVAKEQTLAAKEQETLQKEIEQATAEEEKLTENLAPNAADVILAVVTVGILPAYRIIKAVKMMEKIQSRIDRLHDNRKKEVERQRKALKEMEDCAKAIAQCSDKRVSVKDQAIVALHGAVGALSSLATIMQKAAAFWKSMQNMCEEQSNGKLERLLGTAQKYEDPEERRKAYQNVAVKKRAMKMYVSWVAMEVVCDEYVKKIKGSREELYKYLCENPTIEQSQERIPLLCREFSEQISAENEKMAKQMEQIEEDKKAQSKHQHQETATSE